MRLGPVYETYADRVKSLLAELHKTQRRVALGMATYQDAMIICRAMGMIEGYAIVSKHLTSADCEAVKQAAEESLKQEADNDR